MKPCIIFKTFIFCGCLLACVACQDKHFIVETLDKAEYLMTEHPDSAYPLLQNLPKESIHQHSNQARYALLYTQSQDKNYIDETNDSLIAVAVNYYKESDDVRNKFLSLYYQGRVYTNANELHKAMLAYTEAELLIKEVKDGYLLGLLYAELGQIYRLFYDYPKSLVAHQKAINYYEQAGKLRHRNYMWLNQSRIYRNMNNNGESERLLRIALAEGKNERDSVLIKSCLGDWMMLAVEMQDWVKARALYNELEPLISPDWGTASFMGTLAAIYATEHDLSQAKICIQKGWECATHRIDSINLYLSSAQIEHLAGNEKKAYQDLLSGSILQRNEAGQTLQQPILTIQRDYLSEKLDFQLYELRMEKHLRFLYILLFALLLIVTYLLWKRKLKKEKEKANRTIQELKNENKRKEKESNKKITALLQELQEKEQSNTASIDKLRLELNRHEENRHLYIQNMEKIQINLENELQRKSTFVTELLKKWFTVTGKLILILIQKEEKKDVQYKRLRQEIIFWQEKYFEGNKAFRELEKLVNVYNDNAMLHFRSEIQWANDQDYRRTCYFFAGFPIQIIAHLMNESEDAIYQKRHRLRKLLESSSVLHKDLYLRLLHK